MTEGGWWGIDEQRSTRLSSSSDGDGEVDAAAIAALADSFSGSTPVSGTFEAFVAIRFDTDTARWITDHWSARDHSAERTFGSLTRALAAARRTGARVAIQDPYGTRAVPERPTAEEIADLEARAFRSLNMPVGARAKRLSPNARRPSPEGVVRVDFFYGGLEDPTAPGSQSSSWHVAGMNLEQIVTWAQTASPFAQLVRVRGLPGVDPDELIPTGADEYTITYTDE